MRLRKLVTYVASVFVISFALDCALFQSPASDVEGKAVRSALVQAYEARLMQIVANADTCEDALKGIREEEARWAPIWKRANVAPEPPKVLNCPPTLTPNPAAPSP